MKQVKASYHHGELRKALVDAAAALAAERGPEAVSLRETAKRAGVSHAAPYHHFSGRAELLHAVALEGFRLMDAEMSRAVARKRRGAPRERLAALGQAYIRFAAKNPHYFRAMFRGVKPDDDLPDEHQHGRKNFDLLVAMVQDCLGESGSPSGRVLDRVLAAWAIVHGTASLWVERGFHDTPFEQAGYEALARAVTRATVSVFEPD
ncbi:MAG TPA: TetR/AcrR family transcriptional regulator [Kiritimatiellia bacterium]|nr:TetR/AcrR family transcriptional regulator [Kiritimatiellia bacterium]HMO98186.1 TetR/AcrR family transcriptional regulator [Kiritimatiellia bacterium]HMP97477.1 TetR/AcrR family transcriptional regulator [Kiritimatiellia bacterium]